MNGRRFRVASVPVAGPFGGPIALSSRATFPEVRSLLAQITAGTFLTTEELSS
jgi:hypothetical protein